MGSPPTVASADTFPEDWYEIANEDHFWMRWRLAVLRRLLGDHGLTSGARHVLDIGCGTGTILRQLEGITNWTVDGTDLNRVAVERSRSGRGSVMAYNIFDRAPDRVGRYDAVVLFDVLEHIDDAGAFLAAALDHVRPGGLALVNVPALRALFSRYDDVAGHVRRYDHADLTALLTEGGLRQIDMRFWGFSMVPLAAVRKLMLRSVPTEDVIRRGFHAPSRLAETVLTGMMHLETSLVSRPPLGTSLMALGVKP